MGFGLGFAGGGRRRRRSGGPSLSAQMMGFGTMDSLHWATDGFAPSQWDDLTGNGHHIYQGNGDKQPAKVDDVINGQPVVRFDGVDDHMLASWVRPQPYTILTVCVPTRTGKTFVSILDGQNAWILLDTWDAANIRFLAGGDSTLAPSTVTNPQLITAVANGDSGSLAVNDGTPSPGNGTFEPGGLILGARPGGTTNFGDTDIALVAIYTAITAENLANAKSALNAHYNLY